MLQLRKLYAPPQLIAASFCSNRNFKRDPDPKTSTKYLQKLMNERLRERELDRVIENHAPTDSQPDVGVFAGRYYRRNQTELLKKFPNLEETFDESLKSDPNQRLRIGNDWEIDFPYGEKHTVSVETRNSNPKEPAKSERSIGDRGFYVKSGKFVDDYCEGIASDIPDDSSANASFTKVPSFGAIDDSIPVRSFGPADSSEMIDFQLPGQSPSKADSNDAIEKTEAWRIRYGKPDPSLPPSDERCRGCGAQFHCQDTALPGFLPAQLFERLEDSDVTELLCRRCYLLKHHDFLLNVNVSTVDYRKVMGTLRFTQEALILLLVDMLDFPGSIFRELPSLVGAHKPLMVLGNKVDLLPPSTAAGYVRHFRRSLREEVEKLGFHDRFNLINTQMISAKTGFGIEDLITRIQTRWGIRGDIYLVGCTNTGKSTLFNTFLQSDLCKIMASDLIERATTSIWPGTTLSLLKFPVLNPAPYRLRARFERLKSVEKTNLEDRTHREMAFAATGKDEYAVLQGNVGKTFINQELEKPRRISRTGALGMGEELANKESKRKVFDPELPEFKSGKWCLDTPGTVSEHQIINHLTLEELINVLPKKTIQPRTFNLREDDILLVGGLARLKHLTSGDTKRKILRAAIFASGDLAINIVPENRLHIFLNKYLGTPALGAPLGGKERLKLLPEQKSVKFQFTGGGINLGVADIVLSSIGWVTVCGLKDADYRIEASTPGGAGIFKRDSPLFPLSLNSGFMPQKKNYRRKRNR